MIDCMEVFSKGIHRALVPVDSHMENMSGVELVESTSSYRMLTQMDMVRFLKEHASEIGDIISLTISELGAVTENVFAITHRTKVIEAIKCMRAAMLNAVPIIRVVTDAPEQEYHKQLINVSLLKFMFKLNISLFFSSFKCYNLSSQIIDIVSGSKLYGNNFILETFDQFGRHN